VDRVGIRPIGERGQASPDVGWAGEVWGGHPLARSGSAYAVPAHGRPLKITSFLQIEVFTGARRRPVFRGRDLARARVRTPDWPGAGVVDVRFWLREGGPAGDFFAPKARYYRREGLLRSAVGTEEALRRVSTSCRGR
jgi:hypothetical protein